MIEFVNSRGNTMSHSERDFIMHVFEQLYDEKSYYTTLQVTYNNSLHFTTVPFNICTLRNIFNIAKSALSSNKVIRVNGTIHHNNHISGMLLDANTGEKIFVEDTYINITDSYGLTYHILINPPKMYNIVRFNIIQSENCETPLYFIPPTF